MQLNFISSLSQQSLVRRALAGILVAVFFMTGTGFSSHAVYGQSTAILPSLGTPVKLSSAFTPAMIRGICLHPENALQFDFILDAGDSGLKGDDLKKESEKLVRYFLASLTLPEDDLWVNLSPYEKDRIVPDALGATEMGRDMLAQDYLLKQITASLSDPDSTLGKDFWAKVYQKAWDQYGKTDIPVDTFNKVWIMPDKSEVYVKAGKAFVISSRLKVMLDADYLAAEKNKNASAPGQDTASEISRNIVREIFIPALEKEVNEGRNFAPLRQIHQALILAYWYKTSLKNSVLGQVYADQNKVKGIDLSNPQITQAIYDQYVASFKQGVFNLIREEYDPYSKASLPRKYFSGGAIGKVAGTVDFTERDFAGVPSLSYKVDVTLNEPPVFDASMTGNVLLDLRQKKAGKDYYGMDIGAIFRKFFTSALNLIAQEYSEADLTNASSKKSMFQKELKVIVIDDLRLQLRGTYMEALAVSLPGFDRKSPWQYTRSIDEAIFYFMNRVDVSPGTVFPSINKYIAKVNTKGYFQQLLDWRRTDYVFIDRIDFENMQGMKKSGLVWKDFFEKIEKVSNSRERGDLPEWLSNKIHPAVRGAALNGEFKKIIDRLPAKLKKKHMFSSMEQSLDNLLKRYGAGATPDLKKWGSLPGQVYQAMQIAEGSKDESLTHENSSYTTVQDIFDLSWAAGNRKGITTSTWKFGGVSSDSEEYWMSKLNDELLHHETGASQLEILRSFLREITSPLSMDQQSILLAAVDYFKKTKFYELRVDDVYFLPKSHPFFKNNISIFNAEGTQGQHLYIYDKIKKTGAHFFFVFFDKDTSFENTFFCWLHELIHGIVEQANLNKKSNVKETKRLKGSDGNRSLYRIIDEGFTVMQTIEFAVEMFNNSKDASIIGFKQRLIEGYNSREGVQQSTDTRQVVEYFVRNDISSNYFRFLGIVRLMHDLYGDAMVNDFILNNDYYPVLDQWGDRGKYLASISSMFQEGDFGINEDYMKKHFIFELIESVLRNPHFDQLDFFIGMLNVLTKEEFGRSHASMFNPDREWGIFKDNFSGSVREYALLPLEQRELVRREVMKKLREIAPHDDAGIARHEGGIDFKGKNMSVTLSGTDIEFKLPEDMTFAALTHAPGFVPEVVDISPVSDLRSLLGLTAVARK